MEEEKLYRQIQLITALLATLSTVIAFSVTGNALLDFSDTIQIGGNINITILSLVLTSLIVVLFYKQTHALKEQAYLREETKSSKIVLKVENPDIENDLKQILDTYDKAEIIEQNPTSDGVEYVLRKQEGGEQ